MKTFERVRLLRPALIVAAEGKDVGHKKQLPQYSTAEQLGGINLEELGMDAANTEMNNETAGLKKRQRGMATLAYLRYLRLEHLTVLVTQAMGNT